MILPQAFLDRTKPILAEEFDNFQLALQADVPVSVRFNRNKTKAIPSLNSVPWCSSAYYLPVRPLFTTDPLFHAGLYYVQEAASMFLEQVAKQYFTKAPMRVLDLCAAPGGKSTHLSSLLPEGSLLVSNEFIRSRAYILSENLQKWGSPNTLVCNNTPADLGELSSLFDAILVDAPCSGEGMFRKDAGAIGEWSVQNVETCVARQESILLDVWPALKEGGLLMYSTCTYNREENENRAKWICEELGAELLQIPIDEAWGITATDAGYRFYPHKTKGEGFFMSVLRKTAHGSSVRIKPEKKKQKFTDEQTALKKYVLNSADYKLAEVESKLCLLPTNQSEVMGLLIKSLRILHAGITLGEMKGKSFIPDAALALSNALDRTQCEVVDLDLKTALAFLRTENIVLPDSPKGLVLLTYQGAALGWVKNLGNRCNSLYPSEWRIRMNIPADVQENPVMPNP